MDTTAIILTPARHTATTVPIGSLAASLSVQGLGIIGPTGIGDFTAVRDTTAAAGMDAAGGATGIMIDGASTIMKAGVDGNGGITIAMGGVIESGTVTVDSMVTTDTGTDRDSQRKIGNDWRVRLPVVFLFCGMIL